VSLSSEQSDSDARRSKDTAGTKARDQGVYPEGAGLGPRDTMDALHLSWTSKRDCDVLKEVWAYCIENSVSESCKESDEVIILTSKSERA
jgi:hypothetical protein